MLKELGLLKQQQGQWEPALHALLSVGVGLALGHSPDLSLVKEKLAQLRIQIQEEKLLAMISSATRETPEQTYGLDQARWSAAIQKLVALAFPMLSIW